MAVDFDDIKFFKSEKVTDTDTNGGRVGTQEVAFGIKYNIFPRVTSAERNVGLTRYRKIFLCNHNADNDKAFGSLINLLFPTPAEDRILLRKGTEEDTQASLNDLYWQGCGKVSPAPAGQDYIDILAESDGLFFPTGGVIHICNAFEYGTVEAGIRPGDYVYQDGNWKSTDVISNQYPYGIYLGNGLIHTIRTTSKEEWLRTKNEEYSESIGTGDGTNSPALTNITNFPIAFDEDKLPQITATDTLDNTLTVTIQADGQASGDCSAGQLNLETGEWTEEIVWSAAIKSGSDVVISYTKRCYELIGGTEYRVYLADTLSYDYTGEIYAGACLELGDIYPEVQDTQITSAAGQYDFNYLSLDNQGTVTDTWTITFTSSTEFTCTGTKKGSIGTGSVLNDFAPTNPQTGKPYFTLKKDGFSGSWQTGEKIVFKSIASARGFWLKEIVQAGAGNYPDNLFLLGWWIE
ncbi:hypothetical protein [Desulfovulcanus sp.]